MVVHVGLCDGIAGREVFRVADRQRRHDARGIAGSGSVTVSPVSVTLPVFATSVL